MVRLKKLYQDEIIEKMQKKFGIANMMAVTDLQKIVINMGVGEAISDIKVLEMAMKDLSAITGQQPVVRRAKIAVSNFRLRKGMPLGCKVTLRGKRMYEFLDRLLSIALPRIRDFNGVPKKSFDKQGNYTLGIKDQAIFPEIDTGRMQRTQGMDISFVFSRGTREHTFELLSLLGMPFRK